MVAIAPDSHSCAIQWVNDFNISPEAVRRKLKRLDYRHAAYTLACLNDYQKSDYQSCLLDNGFVIVREDVPNGFHDGITKITLYMRVNE